MKYYKLMVICLAAIGAALPACGGTIITSNLPPNTAIVNIDATADGADIFNGDQSLWFDPFNTSGHLLEYTIQPGTYTFRIVDPADASQMFPPLIAAQTNEIFTAWNPGTQWMEDYLVFTGDAAMNEQVPQLFDGAPDPTSFSDPQSAYNDAVTRGYSTLLRFGPLGRDSTTFTNTWTFTNAQTLIFAVPDNNLDVNSGGVSVVVSSPDFSPQLTVVSSGGNVTIEWTVYATGFTLEQATNLGPTNVEIWQDVSVTPGTTNTAGATNNQRFFVTLPRDAATNRFFRLHKP